MSVDSDIDAGGVDAADVDSIGRELGEAIRDLPEYEAFEEAREAVQADDEAQERIQAFEERRQSFMVARASGEASQADLEALQAAQEELNAMPVMADFLEAQDDLADRLTEVNEAISDPLAVDFGEQAGGCCHD